MHRSGFLIKLLILALPVICWCALTYADTVVTTTTTRPYFYSAGNPIAAIFYFVADLVAFPFNLLGNLFSGV